MSEDPREPVSEPTLPSNPIAVPSGGLKVSWGLGAVGCFAAMLCIFASIVAPILSSAGASRETQQCLGNLRRLSRAMMLYTDDNDGKMPGQDWNKDLAKYEPDEVMFACPHQRRVDPNSSGYALNKALAGKVLKDIENPGQTVMLFDSRPVVPGTITEPSDVPRPGRHRNGKQNGVAYADGRVEAVPAP